MPVRNTHDINFASTSSCSWRKALRHDAVSWGKYRRFEGLCCLHVHGQTVGHSAMSQDMSHVWTCCLAVFGKALVAKPDGSTPAIPSHATGHNPEPVASTCLPHNSARGASISEIREPAVMTFLRKYHDVLLVWTSCLYFNEMDGQTAGRVANGSPHRTQPSEEVRTRNVLIAYGPWAHGRELADHGQ
jgi:hypothetical protein